MKTDISKQIQNSKQKTKVSSLGSFVIKYLRVIKEMYTIPNIHKKSNSSAKREVHGNGIFEPAIDASSEMKKERVQNGTVYWLYQWQGSSKYEHMKAIARRYANLVRSNDDLFFDEATFLKDNQIFHIVADELFGNLLIVEKQEYEPMAENILAAISKEMEKLKQGLSPKTILDQMQNQNSEQEMTFEQAIEFGKKKGMVGDEVYEEIIAASTRTSSIVDRVFGCK